MKKTLSLLLAAAMTLSLLAGCGSKTNDSLSACRQHLRLRQPVSAAGG